MRRRRIRHARRPCCLLSPPRVLRGLDTGQAGLVLEHLCHFRELVSRGCEYLDAGAAAPDGEAARRASRQVALQRWWRFWLAAWVATRGAGVILVLSSSWWQLPCPDLESLSQWRCSPVGLLWRSSVGMMIRVKAPRFGASGGVAYVRRFPLGGTVVGHLSVPELRVKILVRLRTRRRRRSGSLPS